MRIYPHRLCFLLIALAIGCSKLEEDRSTALVRIDGWPLTVNVVSNRVMLETRTHELARRPVDARFFTKWANERAMAKVPELISEWLIVRHLDSLGIVADAEDHAQVLSNALRRARLKDLGREELADRYGDLKKLFLARLENEARFRKFERTSLKIEVSEEEIRDLQQRAKSAQQEAEAVNVQAKERGEAAYRALQSGESWESVADKFSEDRLQGKKQANFHREWMTAKAGNFGLQEVDEVVSGLKVGEYSKPLDTEAGLLIVKVDAFSEEKGYSLSRILIRLMYEVETPASDEEARRQIYREKYSEAQIELINSLKEKAEIEYPLGEEFKYDIWPVGRSSRKLRFGL